MNAAQRCRKKFLRFFPKGFYDDTSETIRRDQRDLKPRDMMDLQSFKWVQGSDEYEE